MNQPATKTRRWSVGRQIRILLLMVALTAAVYAHQAEPDRIPAWDRALVVGIYPHNADGSQAADDFLRTLEPGHFHEIEQFMARSAREHGLALERPFILRLAEPSDRNAPPTPPAAGSLAADLRWALSLRLWRWRFDRQGLDPDIVMVVHYHAPTTQPMYMHSIGILDLRLAVANLLAHEQLDAHNNVVLAHELLHTVGASDLYNPVSTLPLFPQGYAEPNQYPRYPQQQAELMAGRLPLRPGQAREAHGLNEISIGPRTAAEIGWLEP
ncbi:MAG: hypothetical protein EA370_16200 [Wenzhouxiangella sp.]|nr:MAG: hypothetical protein EA370_16200 [Wenzhouxiangella sp.]